MFTSVQFKFLLKPLSVSPPLAVTSPVVAKVPLVHSIGPETVMGIVPRRVPPEKLNMPGVIAPLPLKTTVEPLSTNGVFAMVTLPSRRAVPEKKVLVPRTFMVP